MGKFLERTTAALLTAVLAAGLFLVATSDLISLPGQAAMNGEGRGDNPVVGSLPCAVDEDELGLKFFKWTGYNMTGQIDLYQPTLAMVGGTDIENYIVDLYGTPLGLVNASSGFSAVGSVQQMTLTADRAAASAHDYRVALWLPDGMLGADVEMVSSVGNFSWTAATNAFALPVAMLANAPGALHTATVTVTQPGDSLPSATVQIDIVAGLVIVDFQP